MSTQGELPTCLDLAAARQNSCISPQKQKNTPITSITAGSANIRFKQSDIVRFHPVTDNHICTITGTRIFELRLEPICRFQIYTIIATLVSAIVLSRIHHCDFRLFGSSHFGAFYLQRIQNHAKGII